MFKSKNNISFYLVHVEGLPCSLSKKERFKLVLKHARAVEEAAFKCPKERILVRNCSTSGLMHADAFGLIFIGFDAMVSKTPLVISMGISGEAPPKVLKIHVSTKHMTKDS